MKNFVRWVETFFHNQNRKFKNLTETNLELGKYHLYSGNIRDAIIRFRILKWLFDKKNPEIDYWLGWGYFLNGEYEEALSHLKNAKEFDVDGLSDFIKNYTTCDEVPTKIWHRIQEIALTHQDYKYYLNDVYNKPIDIPKEFIALFLNAIPELKEKAQILDFGCRTGIIGSMLDYQTNASYHITAVDEIEAFTDYVGKIRGERGYIYDKTLLHSLHNADSLFKKDMYDAVCVFDSIGFTKNLSYYFQKIHDSLKDNGSFALMLQLGNNTEWNIEKKTFIYENAFIEKHLSLAQFNIMAIKEWKLKAKKSYIAFICSK